MQKAVLTLASLSLLVLLAPEPVRDSVPGVQTVGVTHLHNCPKGRRYDDRKQTCIKVGN
jgi:hypothetical protein